MEVGAVKQAFNNEIILLKKNLNQAKIQTIHKLTRKAKTLTEKKAPEALKLKLTRKAESAVKEVLIIKKIKPKDIAKFIVTHTGTLNEYLNKPTVDNDKACARLLLHKAMQDKYKHIRGKFSNISIKDLFMSRQERLKLKKEAKEKQKNKKKGKNATTVNVEGEWDVVITDTSKEKVTPNNSIGEEINDLSDNNDNLSDKNASNNDSDKSAGDNDSDKNASDNDISEDENNESNDEVVNDNGIDESIDNESNDNDSSDDSDVDEGNDDLKLEKEGKINELEQKISNNILSKKVNLKLDKPLKKTEKKIKHKDNKNKNLNQKLQKRKFNKDIDEAPIKVSKIVDPFFITSSGDNYMSLVEPRLPDEIKEVHKQGNRKQRRAVMFGHEPKIKPKKHFEPKYEIKQNKFTNNNNKIKFETQNKTKINNDKEVVEKLHPSWEAKKKQSGIVPFKGKKIVFDES